MAYDRAIDSEKLRAEIGDVADKLRIKGGTSDPLQWPDDFKDGIDALKTYSASDNGKVVVNGELVSQSSLSITENDTYDTTDKNQVVVNVQGGGGTLGDKTITANGEYKAEDDNLDGYEKVTVKVDTFADIVMLQAETSYESDAVAAVPAYAFYGLPLTDVELSEAVSIGSNAFQNSALLRVSVPKATSIGSYAFSPNKLEEADFSLVQSVGGYAMYQGTNGQWSGSADFELDLPEALTIGDYAFFRLRAKSISIPKVTSIGAYAFQYLNYSGELELPATLTSLGNYSFANVGCNITFKGQAPTIPQNCFRQATTMVFDFTNCTSVPACSATSAFYGIPNGSKIVVPDNLYDTWRTTTNWSNSSIQGHIVRESDYLASL